MIIHKCYMFGNDNCYMFGFLTRLEKIVFELPGNLAARTGSSLNRSPVRCSVSLLPRQLWLAGDMLPTCGKHAHQPLYTL